VINSAEAWIGQGAQINQNPLYDAPGQSVTVEADTLIETINIGGIPNVLALIKPANKSEGSSVGGTYSGITYDNDAVARIEDGAVVSAVSDVSVTADAVNFAVNIMESGGKAKDFGISGAVAVNDFDVSAQAYIEDTATVSAGGNVVVDANSRTTAVNVTGAVSQSSGVGVGISLAINEVTGDTRAFIGNRDAGNPTLTGAPQLTFAPDGTITRDAGSWTADGFREGQRITVANAAGNEGTYHIAAISEDGLTITIEETGVLGDATAAASVATVGVVTAGNDVRVQAASQERFYAVSIAASKASNNPEPPSDPLAGG
jgi:hypothetical protein